jgi:hypothetical protein
MERTARKRNQRTWRKNPAETISACPIRRHRAATVRERPNNRRTLGRSLTVAARCCQILHGDLAREGAGALRPGSHGRRLPGRPHFSPAIYCRFVAEQMHRLANQSARLARSTEGPALLRSPGGAGITPTRQHCKAKRFCSVNRVVTKHGIWCAAFMLCTLKSHFATFPSIREQLCGIRAG